MRHHWKVFYIVAEIDFADYYDELGELVNDYINNKSPFNRAGAYSIRDINPRFIQRNLWRY